MIDHAELVAILARFFTERFATPRPVGPSVDLTVRFHISPAPWLGIAQEINALPAVSANGLHISPLAMTEARTIHDIAHALLQSRPLPQALPDLSSDDLDLNLPDIAPSARSTPPDSEPSKGGPAKWPRIRLPDFTNFRIKLPNFGLGKAIKDDDAGYSASVDFNEILIDEDSNLIHIEALPGSDTWTSAAPLAPAAKEDDRQTEIRLVDSDTDADWDAKCPIYFDHTWAVKIAIKPPADIGGIPTIGERKPVAIPLLGRAADLLIKLTDSNTTGVALAIAEPFRTITLPPSGASQDCTIQFVATDRRSPEAMAMPAQGRLTVQIYYRLNLIDSIDLELTIVTFQPSAAEPTPAAAQAPVQLIHYRDDTEQDRRALGWLGDDIVPRQLTIFVRSDGNRIALDFTLVRGDRTALHLTATSFVSRDELTTLLLDVREAYTRLILDSFAGDSSSDQARCQKALDCLARLGRRAWALLLDNNAAGDSLVAINTYLRGLRLAPESIIQIVLRDTIADLIFPWALLYDGPEPSSTTPATWDGFWGARYQIEQLVRPTGAVRPLPSDVVNYTFLTWDKFAEAADVRKYLDDELAPPRGIFAGDLTSGAALAAAMLADKINFYCFFCHGHTRTPLDGPFKGLIARQLQVLTDVEQALALAGSGVQSKRDALKDYIISTRELLRSNLATLDHQIILSNATIAYQDFAALVRNIRLTRQPVFLLNMCQSAQFFPGITDNFVALFLKIRAATVIGTECEINPALGEAFGRFFVDALRRGRSAGEAMLDARRTLFTANNNPLGLVYSLYGQASRSLVPRPLPSSPPPAPIERTS